MTNQSHALSFTTLLIELQSQEPERRITALRSIAHQDMLRAIPAILEMMCNPCKWHVERKEAEHTLKHMGVIGRDALIQATFHEDPYCRAVFTDALGVFHDLPAITRLLALADDNDFMVRIRCSEALARMPHAVVLPHVLQAVQERERAPRARAVLLLALYHIGDDQAIEPVIALLRDRSSWVRAGAVFFLCRFANERCHQLLVRSLRDRAVRVRCAAVRALVRFPDTTTIEAIETLRTDPSATVRRVVAEVLTDLHRPPED